MTTKVTFKPAWLAWECCLHVLPHCKLVQPAVG